LGEVLKYFESRRGRHRPPKPSDLSLDIFGVPIPYQARGTVGLFQAFSAGHMHLASSQEADAIETR
jgi:hypothetical protein